MPLSWLTLVATLTLPAGMQAEIDSWRAEKDREMRQPGSPVRHPLTSEAFDGLRYLPIDPRFRVPAIFEANATGKTLSLETSKGGLRTLPFLGVLHFELAGRRLSLEAFFLGDRPHDLFVIFKDSTNGKETYGAGRFLWVKGPVDGKTVVDFNLAWNPLCAYASRFNCPLAPPENRLPVAIPVGEAPYLGHL